MLKIKTTLSNLVETIKALRGHGRVYTHKDTGEFCVLGVEGHFTYDRQEEVVSITITKKPFLIPMATIESKIRGYFNP